MNELGAELLGAHAAEAPGLRIEHFTPVERWPLLDRLWSAFVRDGDLWGTYVLLRGEGRRSLVEFRAQRDLDRGEHLIVAREIRGHAPSPLTGRERQVLQLAADGHSTREIAHALFLSPGTVKTHFKHIYDKFDLRHRAAAVAHALRRGLIS